MLRTLVAPLTWFINWLIWSGSIILLLMKTLFLYLNITVAFLLLLAAASQIVPVLYSIELLGLGPFGDADQADFEREKTLWNWLELLIVPAILAGAALWFNRQTRLSEVDRANDRYREEALQKYFESITDLMLRAELLGAEHQGQVKRVVKMRTVAVLRKLDAERVREVLDFLGASEWLDEAGRLHETGFQVHNGSVQIIFL
jgi:hypothetical protein